MSNFSALKTAIQNAIKQNGNEEITGNLLQNILLSIVETLGDSAINTLETGLSNEATTRGNADTTLQTDINNEATARQNMDTQLQNAINAINTYLAKGYIFAGVATPTGIPVSGRVFYVATTAGRYTSFGNLQVQNGISILLVENGSWTLHQLLVVDLSLVQNSKNPVSGGAVYQAVQYEKNRAIGAEKALHQEIVAETDKRTQEIQGMRDDVLDLIHEYRPIEIEGNVVNAPDEEDITQQPNNLLKFKDKDYNPTIFSGLGRKYLRKNIIINEDYTSFDGFVMNPEADAMLEGQPDSIFWDRLRERFIAEKDGAYYLDWQGSGDYIPVSADKIYVNENIPYFWNGEDLAVDDDVIARYGNILTQEMLSDANTIYVIQYEYTLGGNITIPANCVLEFDGGSISNANGNNYSLTCDNTEIKAGQNKIFGNVTINGSVKNYKICLGWWHDGYTNEDCTFGITNMCALCQPSWEIMHEMVLINNSIKVDPDVFIVNGVSIEGNNCILRSTKDDFSGVGIKYLYGGGFSTNMVQEVKNFRIMDFNIGLWAYDQIRATNLTCQNNNIGCRIGTGGAYISDFEKCLFFRNRQYGVVTEKDGGGIADTKFVRCWLSGNAYANALHKGDTFVRYIGCNIEDCGRGRNIGYGIICNGYPTGLYIRDCYFERGSNGIDGKYKDISVLVFGKLTEIDDADVRADLENIGVGINWAVGDSRCKVEISGTAFININGLYFSCAQAVQLNLENLYFGIPQDAEHCYGVRFNYVSGPYWKGYFSNIQFYNYTKGIAKTAFSFSTSTLEAYVAAIAKQLRLDGVKLGYYTNPYHIFYTFNNNEHLLDCGAGTNKVQLYEVGYKLRNAADFIRKTIYRENESGTTISRYKIKDNTKTLAGKYLIVFGRVGTSFVYYNTSNVGTRAYITENVQIIKLPSDFYENKGVEFAYTPYYIIAITEEEFKNTFDCIGFDVIDSVQINTGYVNHWPEIYVTRENANAVPLQYSTGEGVKYYLDGFKALGKKGSTRPTLTNTDADKGYQFFDYSINKPIFWTGTSWVDATGASV